MTLTMNVRISNRVLSVPVIVANDDTEVNVNLADEPTLLRNEGKIFFSHNFMRWLLNQHGVEPTIDNIDEVIDQVALQLEAM